MTMDLQDAPWIREAELYGMPEARELKHRCPVCGADEPESYVIDMYDTVIGCNCCCKFRDAYEWTQEHLEENE